MCDAVLLKSNVEPVQWLCAGSAWSPGAALAKAALLAGVPGARAGTRTVNVECACPLLLIQGSVNSGADCGSVALRAVSG